MLQPITASRVQRVSTASGRFCAYTNRLNGRNAPRMNRARQPPDAGVRLQALESIRIVRQQRVIIDSTLADLYGVTTRRLNEQVRRNRHRFPDDFLFELNAVEFAHLKSHFATSSWGGRRKPPLAFTEHGAIMVATILNSSRAVQMSVYVVRAFVSFRQTLASHASLARKLHALERSLVEASAQTQRQFRAVYEAIRLLQPRTTARRRQIGFIQDPEDA
jgi:hypothetical protein